MSEASKQAPKPVASFQMETQSERWVKYGANVALSVLIVLILVALLVYLGGRANWRKDTTAAGAYSLKPQTVRLIENLPQKVRIVGLFSKAQQDTGKKTEDDTNRVHFQQVADLIQEYQEKSGGKISAEMIDTTSEPGKVDRLFNDVAKKYGNDFNKYEEVLKAYAETFDKISKLATADIEALNKAKPKITDQKMLGTMIEIIYTVNVIPDDLDKIKRGVKEQLELKVPDYKGATEAIRSGLQNLVERADAVLKQFKTSTADAKTAPEFKEYIASATPRYEEMKKVADELLKKITSLGELKQLDELSQNKTNSVAILAENDLKVIPSSAIWKTDSNTSRMIEAEGKVKSRFAGEQQISTALVTLTSKDKKRVAFIRSGGAPATLSLPMVGYQGYMSEVGDRLREYGMDVVEKDISGQWQMQAMQMQMQGMPLPPEATDEQIKNAVWVVQMTQQDPRMLMQNPSAGMLGPKLDEHLKNGGSALVLVDVQTEKMDFLKDWGIQTRPEYIVVHEKIAPTGARSEDVGSDVQRQQPFFVLNEFGDHKVTQPLRSLDALFVPLIPVETVAAKGVKTTKILPVPTDPKSWGESDIDAVREGKTVNFNQKSDDKEGDLAGPLWAGAVAEKENGKGRLIVIGCEAFAADRFLHVPNIPVSNAQGRFVARFPGNSELFVNSVFWLADMDSLVAISPAAMEVPRVKALPKIAVDGIRVYFLIVMLPLMVLAAGMFVYLKRRD
jgi:hypothetical protein